MTVYVDSFYIAASVMNGSRTVRGKWCHLTADTSEELNAMADKIGLRRSWIQDEGIIGQEHYDVTMSKRKLAVEAGAVEVDFREHVRKRMALYQGWKKGRL